MPYGELMPVGKRQALSYHGVAHWATSAGATHSATPSLGHEQSLDNKAPPFNSLSAHNFAILAAERVSCLCPDWRCRHYYLVPERPQGAALPSTQHHPEPMLVLLRQPSQASNSTQCSARSHLRLTHAHWRSKLEQKQPGLDRHTTLDLCP